MKRVRPWLRLFARAGYASRGVIYVVIGLFAILGAAGAAEETNSKGALQEILHQPLGHVMVLALLVGLVGYVVWRLIQAVMDTDDHGWSAKGLAVRGGLLASALTYATLATYALALLGVFASGTGDSRPVADFVAGMVGSKVMLAGLAVVFCGVAGAHWYKAAARKYARHFRAGDAAMKVIHPVSMIGLAARGLVFAVLAVLLSYRLFQKTDVDGHPPGIKDAMDYLQQQPYGAWLLGSLGVGLLLFAAYSFIEAVWRRINLEDA